MRYIFCPVGDQAISIQFDQEISQEVHQQVMAMSQAIRQANIYGIGEIVPAYASLLVYYDPIKITYTGLVSKLQALSTNAGATLLNKKMITIPAIYGGEYGPDLDELGRMHGLTSDEVIQLHSAVSYTVYMIGFSPGFPYLGGLPSQLHTPRLAAPRSIVPAGSIGIAGPQTGIYSLSTPGGWRIIAHTPIKLFDVMLEEQSFLIRTGDVVRFDSVSVEEYREIVHQIQNGTYRVDIVQLEEE